MASGVNIMISWSHSYSVMATFCQYYDIMITLLQRDVRTTPVRLRYRLRYRLALIGAQVTLQPELHWIAAVRVVGKQSASLVCFWDSYIYIYILHIYNIYQRKSNSKVFHVHNCIGLETCIYIYNVFVYIYIYYTTEKIIVRYCMFTIALNGMQWGSKQKL